MQASESGNVIGLAFRSRRVVEGCEKAAGIDGINLRERNPPLLRLKPEDS
jgi:hypothetical protein